MKINNNFAVAGTNPTKNNTRTNTPSFGIIKPDADMFLYAVPEVRKRIGEDLLYFIKKQGFVNLDYKTNPFQHLSLNWSESTFVPRRNALDVYENGGLKIVTTAENFSDYMSAAKIMAYYTAKSKLKYLERREALVGLTQLQINLKNNLHAIAREIETCPLEEYNKMQAAYTGLFSTAKRAVREKALAPSV